MASIARTLALVLVLGACGTDPMEPPKDPPMFDLAWMATYTEVRNCRKSADHDLQNIRVLADASAAGPFLQRDAPFPDGSIILKVQYDFGDLDCTGEVQQFTVMKKLTGTVAAPATAQLGYDWQRVDSENEIVTTNDTACFGCHSDCFDPSGYLGTCAVP